MYVQQSMSKTCHVSGICLILSDSYVYFDQTIIFQYVVIVGLLVILELAGVVLFFIINDEVRQLSTLFNVPSIQTAK